MKKWLEYKFMRIQLNKIGISRSPPRKRWCLYVCERFGAAMIEAESHRFCKMQCIGRGSACILLHAARCTSLRKTPRRHLNPVHYLCFQKRLPELGSAHTESDSSRSYGTRSAPQKVTFFSREEPKNFLISRQRPTTLATHTRYATRASRRHVVSSLLCLGRNRLRLLHSTGQCRSTSGGCAPNESYPLLDLEIWVSNGAEISNFSIALFHGAFSLTFCFLVAVTCCI